MGINKGFTFDGESSLYYDIFISGDATYNAPEREVEMINVPGRNGSYALDKGRFENIEVTYPAGTFDTSQANFADKIATFRNVLASRKGYKRLEDEYHPNEYRLALFKRGLEVDPVSVGKAGEFDITFDCKPQRFLTSGEAENEYTADGSITNPTLFESNPLLKVEGRGTIELNGYPIEINVDPLGVVPLFDSVSKNGTGSAAEADADFGNVAYISGDSVYVKNSKWVVAVQSQGGAITNSAPTGTGLTTTGIVLSDTTQLRFSAVLSSATFTAGSAETKSYTANCGVTISGTTYSVGMTIKLIYDGDENIRTTLAVSISDPILNITSISATLGAGTVDSTATSLNETLYIDCELGEVYTSNGQSYNNAVSLGTNLPKLSPGANAFTLANTITKLTIIPRWWRI